MLPVDKDNYEKARYKVKKWITEKIFFETKLTKTIARPKDLWNHFKSLNLSSKSSASKLSQLRKVWWRSVTLKCEIFDVFPSPVWLIPY